MSPTRAYLEHVAVRVRDIQWHIRFFETVFGWKIRMSEGADGIMSQSGDGIQMDVGVSSPKQVWIGGIQLISEPLFDGTAGRAHHVGVRCEDVDQAMRAAYTFAGVTHLERGRNWLVLPEGMVVELLPTSVAAVEVALRVHPEL